LYNNPNKTIMSDSAIGLDIAPKPITLGELNEKTLIATLVQCTGIDFGTLVNPNGTTKTRTEIWNQLEIFVDGLDPEEEHGLDPNRTEINMNKDETDLNYLTSMELDSVLRWFFLPTDGAKRQKCQRLVNAGNIEPTSTTVATTPVVELQPGKPLTLKHFHKNCSDPSSYDDLQTEVFEKSRILMVYDSFNSEFTNNENRDPLTTTPRVLRDFGVLYDAVKQSLNKTTKKTWDNKVKKDEEEPDLVALMRYLRTKASHMGTAQKSIDEMALKRTQWCREKGGFSEYEQTLRDATEKCSHLHPEGVSRESYIKSTLIANVKSTDSNIKALIDQWENKEVGEPGGEVAWGVQELTKRFTKECATAEKQCEIYAAYIAEPSGSSSTKGKVDTKVETPESYAAVCKELAQVKKHNKSLQRREHHRTKTIPKMNDFPLPNNSEGAESYYGGYGKGKGGGHPNQ